MSQSRGSRRRLLAVFSDRDVDDDLLRHLVATVFATRSSLYASIGMSAILILTAWAITRDPRFAVLAAAQCVVAAGRLSVIWRFKIEGAGAASRAEIQHIDRAFTFWAFWQALILGVAFYLLENPGFGDVGMPLAVGGASGFCVAFVTRSAARMRLLALQILAVLTPVVYGLVTMPVSFGLAYALLFSGLAMSTLLMGATTRTRVIDHFRVNEANRKMARLDMLTGALNRFAFNDALARSLGPGRRPFALLTIDLDRFKEINDSAGHPTGDKVLIETARRLSAICRPDDVVARLGGDEFVVIALRVSDDPDCVEAIARRYVEGLRAPFAIGDRALVVGASVGVALYPEHGRQVEELMKRSDLALYEAKLAGRDSHRVFSGDMLTRFEDSRRLELAIEGGLKDDGFEPWFQPIQDLDTGEVIGYEALARWRHPTLGLIPPDRFIPVAEKTGAIVEIGRRIIEKACIAATGWEARATLAVNLSPVQFRNAETLVETIFGALRVSGLQPSRLFLEITESLMLEDSPSTRAAVVAIRAAGVRFSLDDFGSGYSSLAYIQNYPFAKIKIDRRFVDQLGHDDTSSAIVASVCVLADRLGMEVVAEGVETRAQQASLRALGVGQGQGYLYGRPAPNPDGAKQMDVAISA